MVMRVKEIVVSWQDGIKICVHDEATGMLDWYAINDTHTFRVGDEVQLILRKKEVSYAAR